MNFQVRGEFVNIFNRTELPNPSTASPQNALVHNSLGILYRRLRSHCSVPGSERFEHILGPHGDGGDALHVLI